MMKHKVCFRLLLFFNILLYFTSVNAGIVHSLHFTESDFILQEKSDGKVFITSDIQECSYLNSSTLCLPFLTKAYAIPYGSYAKSSLQDLPYNDYPYQELFTEGKEWTMHHIGMKPGEDENSPHYETHWIIKVKVDGSKEIDGIMCKRLIITKEAVKGSCNECRNWLDYDFIDEFIQHEYEGITLGIPSEVYVYESDRKIFFYRNPGLKYSTDNPYIVEGCEPYFELYMDLNQSIGDNGKGMGLIVNDEMIEINSKFYRRLSSAPIENTLLNWYQYSQWIEGIGANIGLSMYHKYYKDMGPIMTEICAPFFILTNCKENGITLYDQTELLRTLGLEKVTKVNNIISDQDYNSDKCYDLNGRPLDNLPIGEFFIRNGKISFIKR